MVFAATQPNRKYLCRIGSWKHAHATPTAYVRRDERRYSESHYEVLLQYCKGVDVIYYLGNDS